MSCVLRRRKGRKKKRRKSGEEEEQEEEEEEEEELCTPCDLTSPNISGPPAKLPLALQSRHRVHNIPLSPHFVCACVSTLMNLTLQSPL